MKMVIRLIRLLFFWNLKHNYNEAKNTDQRENMKHLGIKAGISHVW